KDSTGRERVLQGIAFDVREFGAVGDGNSSGVGTDDEPAIQAAIDAANSAGGGAVIFEAKTYVVGSNIEMYDNVELRGVRGVTVLIAESGSDVQILSNPASGGTNVAKANMGLVDIIFGGNKANGAGANARSCVTLEPAARLNVKGCVFRNALGYGLGLQSRPGHASNGPNTDIYLENCDFHDNGDGIGGDTYDGLDIKDCDRMTLINCRAYDNALEGFDFRGREISLFNCVADGNGGNGCEMNANVDGETTDTSVNIIAGRFTDNGEAGISIANGGTGTGVSRIGIFNPHVDNNTE